MSLLHTGGLRAQTRSEHGNSRPWLAAEDSLVNSTFAPHEGHAPFEWSRTVCLLNHPGRCFGKRIHLFMLFDGPLYGVPVGW